MKSLTVWVNGELVDASSPAVNASDHGFLLGDGVFDTLVVRHRRPVFIDRHLRRLRRGIERLQLNVPLTDLEFVDAISQLIDANELTDARVRITVTPGAGSSPRDRGPTPLVAITTAPLQPSPESVSLCTVTWTRNEHSPLAGMKSTSWGDNAVILRHAHERGFDNAILCDTSGRLSECTTSNLFLVVDDQLLTPSLESGCLPGIIREVLIEANVATASVLTPADLERATEVFVTSSTTGVMPVHRVDDHPHRIDGSHTANARAVIDRFSALDAT